VNILKIGISQGHAFVGINGPYWMTNADGTVRAPTTAEAAGALGVALSDVNLGIALLKPTDSAFSGESYYGIVASGSVQLVGLDAFLIAVRNLNIEVNGATGSANVVDFVNSFGATGLEVATGPLGAHVNIALTHQIIHAEGQVRLTIGQFVDISGILSVDGIRTSADFADALLEQARVAVTPGEAFDAPGFIRISYATSMENLREGSRRLLEFVSARAPKLATAG